jgi:CO/xanthine dehydrogenase FAD-binding subunit
MIIEYHRPKTLEAALSLLARREPPTYPLGGGTVLIRPRLDEFAAVDLQALGLNKIRKSGKNLDVGAMVTLQALHDHPDLPEALRRTLDREANFNLRQVASLAGTLVACDGRSAFAAAVLALDAKLSLQPGDEEISLGNLLPQRGKFLGSKLITKITLPLGPRLACESVARTPADRPLVCAALAQWPSGRTRLTLGGWGEAPLLALDGNEPIEGPSRSVPEGARRGEGIEAAARDAFAEATDAWASAEYRAETAVVLARRCLDLIAQA